MGAADRSSAINVAVRVRPLNEREKKLATRTVVETQGNIVLLKSPFDKSEIHQFAYDYSYNSMDRSAEDFTSQDKVYNDLGVTILDHAFNGYNACLFAYGQTGSGKTFSMMGKPTHPELKGITPRLCDELFERIAVQTSKEIKYKVEVCYMEIYNERVKCLLNPKLENLRVRENPSTGPYVERLTKLLVTSYKDVRALMEEGNKARSVAATLMNETSSRSHAIFTILFTQIKSIVLPKGKEVTNEVVSKINLVDLAGSERASKSGANTERLREGSSINKSLTVLGQVISGLVSGSHTPYRESSLTWILKENLGGNSKTLMLSAISPAADNYEETLSTLRFANRAKAIVTKAVVNENPTDRMIRQLKEEVLALKGQLASAQEAALAAPPEELREQVKESERIIAEMNMTWEDKMKQTAQAQDERRLVLKDLGIEVVKVEGKLPHLVNLNEDPNMVEALVYFLKEGATSIGSQSNNDQASIVLSGECIAPQHCAIRNESGSVTLEPLPGASTFVNGVEATEPVALRQSDRLTIGGHWFRFTDPRAPPLLRMPTLDIGFLGDLDKSPRGLPTCASSESMGILRADSDLSSRMGSWRNGASPTIIAPQSFRRLSHKLEPRDTVDADEEGSRQPTGDDVNGAATPPTDAGAPDPRALLQQRRDARRQGPGPAGEARAEAEAGAEEGQGGGANGASRVHEHTAQTSNGVAVPGPAVGDDGGEGDGAGEEAGQAHARRRQQQQDLEGALRRQIEEELRAELGMQLKRDEEPPRPAAQRPGDGALPCAGSWTLLEGIVQQEEMMRGKLAQVEEVSRLGIGELQAESARHARRCEERRRELDDEVQSRVEEALRLRDQTPRVLCDPTPRGLRDPTPRAFPDQTPRTFTPRAFQGQTPRPGSAQTPRGLRDKTPRMWLDQAAGTPRAHSLTPRALRDRTPRVGDPVAAPAAAGPSEDRVPVFRYNLVFVGDAAAGKTSLRKCLLGAPAATEEAALPAVRPTAGVEVTEQAVAVGDQQLELQLVDMSGQSCYHTHNFFLPEKRAVFVVVWRACSDPDLLPLTRVLENLQAKAPGSWLFVVGTHKDDLRDDADGAHALLAAVRAAVRGCLEEIEPDRANRLKIAGNYLGTCRGRLVQREGLKGAPITFPELLQVMAAEAMRLAKKDPVYPNCLVPGCALAVSKSVSQMRRQGIWVLTGMEYKKVAAKIDPTLRQNVEELGRLTALLHSWRALVHFQGSAALQKYIFTNPQWVLDLLSALFSCVHCHRDGAGRLDEGDLWFDLHLMRRADPLANVARGLLSVDAATVLYRRLLLEINQDDRGVGTCLELMGKFDLLYRMAVPTRPDDRITATDPVWEDPEDGAGMRFAVPALFTGSLPPALVQALPEALCGHRKKYDFSVLPSDFFPRCLARVSRCVQRLFVGPAHFPDDARTCDANAFWADGAWIQDTECTRALMRLSGRTLHLHFNGNPGEPQSPATLLVAGLHNVVAGLASEYRGMVVSEAVHCPAPACRHWLEVGKELPPGAPPNVGVVCPACGGVFKYDQVTLQRPPNPAERRARALKGLVDDPQVSPARRERLQGLLARYCGPALTEAEEVCFLDSLVEALLQP